MINGELYQLLVREIQTYDFLETWKQRIGGIIVKWDKRIGIPYIEDRSEVRSARMSLSNVMLKDSLLESGLSLIKYHNYRAEFERCP